MTSSFFPVGKQYRESGVCRIAYSFISFSSLIDKSKKLYKNVDIPKGKEPLP
jgi:hypothetical protein